MTQATTGVALGELVTELAPFAPTLAGSGGTRVSDVEQDSRRVTAGALFVARTGARENGQRFIGEALARGAAAVMIDAGVRLGPLSCPVLTVAELPRALAIAAEAVHRWPSRDLAVVGITGTNGKTTTAWLVQRALVNLGIRAARIGTLGFEFEGRAGDLELTTPEADALSRSLAVVKQSGGTHVAMEVSSVALVQHRVDGVRFDVAAFTNLTRDHLDFHGTFEAYRDAKGRLFRELGPRAAVLEVGDPFGRELAREAAGRAVTVGPGAFIDGSFLQAMPDGLRGDVLVDGRRFSLRSRLVGRHNADNLMLALGILRALGHDTERAVAALAGVGPAPGRLERCDAEGDDCTVLVDYAHTPDALLRVLAAVEPPPPARLLCVFGCGGERDPGKREPMGRAVGQTADFAIITNDNPRGEPPEEIASAVERGLCSAGAAYEICLDRAEAIDRAIAGAAPGDVVLIAGKGHEPYQIIGAQRLSFDDREQARLALARRRAAAGGRTWRR